MPRIHPGPVGPQMLAAYSSTWEAVRRCRMVSPSYRASSDDLKLKGQNLPAATRNAHRLFVDFTTQLQAIQLEIARLQLLKHPCRINTYVLHKQLHLLPLLNRPFNGLPAGPKYPLVVCLVRHIVAVDSKSRGPSSSERPSAFPPFLAKLRSMGTVMTCSVRAGSTAAASAIAKTSSKNTSFVKAAKSRSSLKAAAQ
ncbi:hypothetical protein PMIN01_05054 [Paraphaeosphaeria minitans]|uniref:Uncharacterized protein n=1 Tax=Paraphaeosphaeria minitans TaxID=565426 RepID=A0A9P6KSI2_9PLEO|nr:hypothetical protein PMIN01_05054 [Paraphaeosphaeria minitans]